MANTPNSPSLLWLLFVFVSAAHALVAADTAKTESLQLFETDTLMISSPELKLSSITGTRRVTPNRTETTFSTRTVLFVVTEDERGQAFETTGTGVEISVSSSASLSKTKTTSRSSAWPFTIIPFLKASITKVKSAPATATAASDMDMSNTDMANNDAVNNDAVNNDAVSNDIVNTETGQRSESEITKTHSADSVFVSVILTPIDTGIILSTERVVEVATGSATITTTDKATTTAIKTVTVTRSRTFFSTSIVKPHADIPSPTGTGTTSRAHRTTTTTTVPEHTKTITSTRTTRTTTTDPAPQQQQQPQQQQDVPAPAAVDPVVVTVIVTASSKPTYTPQLNTSPLTNPLLHAAPLPPSPKGIASLYHPPQNRLLNCYHTGRWESRADMIKSITSFCRYLSREAHGLSGPHPKPDESMSPPKFYIPSTPYDTSPPPDAPDLEAMEAALEYLEEEDNNNNKDKNVSYPLPLVGYRQHQFNFVDMGFVLPYTHVLVSLEVKPGCEWPFSQQECNAYLRIPVDQCQRGSGEQFKKGGTVQGRTGMACGRPAGWAIANWNGCRGRARPKRDWGR
ncbi:hypothetical protein QBC32DRAFT_401427 [Pseudoneurospora amorphoporcata]|uniref:Uncharacterized protein n=1 Tax=Pseudoneurospora amorphoporcata TaxID=241081 RepID=A0AAN6NM89_9PEZI|nr:hypothetical protein QBC32DRAFT_401427 [Pseudoneurospora amorphoporcata]